MQAKSQQSSHPFSLIPRVRSSVDTQLQTLSQKHGVERRWLNASLHVTPDELELRLTANPPAGLAWKSVRRLDRSAVPPAGSDERKRRVNAAIEAFNEAVGNGINSVHGIGAFLNKDIIVESQAPGSKRSPVRIRFVNPVRTDFYATFTDNSDEEALMNLQFQAKNLISKAVTRIEAAKDFKVQKGIFLETKQAISNLERRAKLQAVLFAESREMQAMLPNAKVRKLVDFQMALHDALKQENGRLAQRLGLIKRLESAYR